MHYIQFVYSDPPVVSQMATPTKGKRIARKLSAPQVHRIRAQIVHLGLQPPALHAQQQPLLTKEDTVQVKARPLVYCCERAKGGFARIEFVTQCLLCGSCFVLCVQKPYSKNKCSEANRLRTHGQHEPHSCAVFYSEENAF
jgi:hypothetical protein